MREEVSIQAQTFIDDGQGGSTATWGTVASEWAKATQLTYSRALSEGGIMFTTAYNFIMRKRGDTYTLGGEHRILMGGVAYTIHSVVEDKGDLIILAYR